MDKAIELTSYHREDAVTALKHLARVMRDAANRLEAHACEAEYAETPEIFEEKASQAIGDISHLMLNLELRRIAHHVAGAYAGMVAKRVQDASRPSS